jgi:hypothetical protein
MYIQGYLQGSENGRVVTIDCRPWGKNNVISKIKSTEVLYAVNHILLFMK